MERINSIADFTALQARLMKRRQTPHPAIVISAGTCGQASGANDLIRIAKRELLFKGLTDRIDLRVTGCHGFCEMEPSVLVEPGEIFYPKVSLKDMARIVEAVDKGEVLEDLLYTDSSTGRRILRQSSVPFYARQMRMILSASEKVDPIRIYNYIENDGYSAFCKVLENGDSAWTVEQVKTSGLRGRGGAGFPTGLKWEMLARQSSDKGKYIVCNADEGDPGAYMDRSVLEGNPHSVIEGMLIGAFATGATEGVIYVRAEYPLAIKHLLIGLRQARELGLLGKNILGTEFSFDIRLVKGAGAFVCGEETALMHSIEGKMGEPRQRPPFPVTKGINGKPTSINNVETWANVSLIFRIGARAYASIGTGNSSGTKIFSLVGKIKNTGLVEVPMGMTLKEIIYEIGGGPSGDAKIKAVQTGGPSGGCIPAHMFDLAIDYDSLARVGSIMGSGGMIVMDENTCMVDVAKYFMKFLKDESCGKCFTCRKGTQRMYELLEDITEGRGTLKHLDLLEELALVVKDTTMCGLGQSAPNPVLSTLKYFRDEYLEHIWNKRCPAGVCSKLVGAPCMATCPLGTEPWRYIALLEKGEYEEAYQVIRETNPFPSVCARVCSHPCESRCRLRTTGEEAVAIRTLKRFVTDNVDPSVYEPEVPESRYDASRVAVVGAGPAGLAAAHYLSLKGHKVTVFEAERNLGGMLFSCIPDYRLPRDIIQKEIDSLLNDNIKVECGKALGKDFTVDDLFSEGYKAVFLGIGAHKSIQLGVNGEETEGVYPSMDFLKAFDTRGGSLARGRVGIIGGGNSAIDAARVALRQESSEIMSIADSARTAFRQPGVENVTIFYRRTRSDMPAFSEEIEAAEQEGVKLLTLVSPVEIVSRDGRLVGLKIIENQLGEYDSSGRRRPVPIPGSEHIVPLDTLIVAISESPDSECLKGMGLELNQDGTLKVDKETLCTVKPGVFGGGDLITGPNTVVDAIAAGKRAATVIDRYLKNEELRQPGSPRMPQVYIEPSTVEVETRPRVGVPTIPLSRRRNFAEVELTLSADEAAREARRCLRCDLEFTQARCENAQSCVAEEQRT
jgi:NADH-quinone oxidoreductase subunit F